VRDPTGLGIRTLGWLFALGFTFLLTVPFALIVWKSLLSLDPSIPSQFGSFVGLGNYYELFFQEPEFFNSLRTTGLFLLGGLAQCVIAFCLALWLAHLWPTALPKHLVIVLAIPFVMSPSAVGLMGILYLHDQVGILTTIMRELGLSTGTFAPLATPDGAMISICVLDAWRWIPITALFFWFCFRLIPEREIEAAFIDGMGRLVALRYLLLSRAGAAIGIITIVRLLDCLRLFDIPAVLTGGGPGTATMTLSIYANRVTFVQQRFGLAAAHLTVLYCLVTLFVFPLIGRAARFRKELRGARL
jgi:multiple sugar transport system permease protein